MNQLVSYNRLTDLFEVSKVSIHHTTNRLQKLKPLFGLNIGKDTDLGMDYAILVSLIAVLQLCSNQNNLAKNKLPDWSGLAQMKILQHAIPGMSLYQIRFEDNGYP